MVAWMVLIFQQASVFADRDERTKKKHISEHHMAPDATNGNGFHADVNDQQRNDSQVSLFYCKERLGAYKEDGEGGCGGFGCLCQDWYAGECGPPDGTTIEGGMLTGAGYTVNCHRDDCVCCQGNKPVTNITACSTGAE